MAKFYGEIGYVILKEENPGVWVEQIIAQNYFGDVIRDVRNLQASEHLNDNVNISNQISIVADSLANNNFHAMRYVQYMGSKWKITSVEVQYPRLLLSLGGLYNA